MKPSSLKRFFLSSRTLQAVLPEIWTEYRRQKLPLALFLGMCLNLVLAPLVYAATEVHLSRTQAWTLGLLGLATTALSIYLFFVMFVPEKF